MLKASQSPTCDPCPSPTLMTGMGAVAPIPTRNSLLVVFWSSFPAVINRIVTKNSRVGLHLSSVQWGSLQVSMCRSTRLKSQQMGS